jgi:tRNA(Ile)-lysidine synthase
VQSPETDKRAARDPFVDAVGRFIDDNALITRGERVLVAVSGGADSVALLAALRELAARDGREWSLSVAHLNHGLRDQAGEDEHFVRDLAGGWSLPCIVASRDVATEARRAGTGIEETARALRYHFLAEATGQFGASAVAVGHHADDNVETIVHRLARGTHLRGLAGIAPARMLGESVRLVRPLLGVGRKDVEDYCRRAGLAWREDHTNARTDFSRNFIRHELLPVMRDRLNPRLDEAVARLAAAAGEAEEYLLAVAAEVIEAASRPAGGGQAALDVETLRAQPPIMRRYVLRLALERLGAPQRSLGASHLHDLAELVCRGGAMSLPGELVARAEGGTLIIGPQPSSEPSGFATVCLAWPGSAELGGGRRIDCRVEPIDRRRFELHCRGNERGIEMIDADKVRWPLTLRPRRDGDSFRPLGRGGTQTVSDFLTNLKAPADLRARAVCVCDELGIIYLAPLRIDQRVRVDGGTSRVLVIAAAGLAQ